MVAFSAIPGHPKVVKAAVIDVVTPDTEHGPRASTAEMLRIIDDCLNIFPSLAQQYQIHISHSRSKSWLQVLQCLGLNLSFSVYDMAMNHVPPHLRVSVLDILNQAKPSFAQKRTMLLKKGLQKQTIDELELFMDTCEHFHI